MIGQASPFLPAYFPSFFGLHSLANRCASVIWAVVIFEATRSLNVSKSSHAVFEVIILLIKGG